MPDYFSDLAGNLKGKRLDVPDSFADDIMSKIEQRREGGFRSMSVPSRILLSTVVLAIYCSLGVLLGLKGYSDLQPDGNSSSHEALVELMDSHYISTDLLHDPIFRNFVCK
ncbi:MAG TPA: hypothetical protein PLT88_12045 [Bacteroidales bacterium]|jgi:hypothetical protein|nr:hypothetical protein [Bacteroidales bacterium]NLD63013.1 hypothetical protein [Bacteroidales bacterium]HPE23745.1 hypothetical protein [Bacteroidales bacterium]HRW28163.1 hypothetical protein [Bacteroidales bacterium]